MHESSEVLKTASVVMVCEKPRPERPASSEDSVLVCTRSLTPKEASFILHPLPLQELLKEESRSWIVA
jgi:hypothetical protein